MFVTNLVGGVPAGITESGQIAEYEQIDLQKINKICC